MSTSSDGRRDPLSHLGDATGEVWKWHNITFYRKLQREASNSPESEAELRTACLARAGQVRR